MSYLNISQLSSVQGVLHTLWQAYQPEAVIHAGIGRGVGELVFWREYQPAQVVMVDAEDSWIQTAVDNLVNEMKARYNSEKAIVWNTIQMYRTGRLEYLAEDLKRAAEKGYFLGYKFVRGAYMEKERERARSAMRQAAASAIEATSGKASPALIKVLQAEFSGVADPDETIRTAGALALDIRRAAIHAERKALIALWRNNEIGDEVLHHLEELLDYREAQLKG